jgi:hypothetical protein
VLGTIFFMLWGGDEDAGKRGTNALRRG